MVLLSTYDEDQFDLDGCGAAAYVAKAAFGPDRLSAAWADGRPASAYAGWSAPTGTVTVSRPGSAASEPADGRRPGPAIACRSAAVGGVTEHAQDQPVAVAVTARSRRGPDRSGAASAQQK